MSSTKCVTKNQSTILFSLRQSIKNVSSYKNWFTTTMITSGMERATNCHNHSAYVAMALTYTHTQ